MIELSAKFQIIKKYTSSTIKKKMSFDLNFIQYVHRSSLLELIKILRFVGAAIYHSTVSITK